jgi:hypothetical protein
VNGSFADRILREPQGAIKGASGMTPSQTIQTPRIGCYICSAPREIKT